MLVGVAGMNLNLWWWSEFNRILLPPSLVCGYQTPVTLVQAGNYINTH